MRSLFYFAAAAAALTAAGVMVLPNARDAARLLAASDDPAAIADFRLSRLTGGDYISAIDAALRVEDPELAASLVNLADSRGIPISPADRQKVDEAQGFDVGHLLDEAWRGAAEGDASTESGLAGAVLADLSGIGDVRDILREGTAYLDGGEYDTLTLGLAAVGLAATGATVFSLGTAAPARVGVTVLKTAHRAGKLSPLLRRELVTLARNTVDGDALRAVVGRIKTGDIGGARRALSGAFRSAPLNTLKTTAADLGTITTTAGYRATAETLKIANSSADLGKLRLLAARMGKGFRGGLALLGGAALTLGGLALTLSGWIATAALWLLAAVYFSWRVLGGLLRIILRPHQPAAVLRGR